MKKIICVMIILSVFLSTNVSASDGRMMATGATALGSGIGFFFLPSLMETSPSFNPSFSTYAIAYTAGTVFGVGGLILFIAGAMRDDPYYAKLKSPLPDIVSITSDGRSTFIGAKFSFK